MNAHRIRRTLRNPSANGRRGAALVFVLIFLLFLSMLGISLTRLAIAQHRQQLQEELRSQAVRLAEAGANRALTQAALSPDYQGEVWQVDASALGSERTANIRIEIQPADANRSFRIWQVTAEYPVGSPQIQRVSREGPLPAK